MVRNHQPAVCQQQDTAAQGQARKGHGLVISSKILQCSHVLPGLGHFTALNAVKVK